MQIKNEALRRFIRRRGAYILGILAASGIIVLAVIGRNKSVDIGTRYIKEDTDISEGEIYPESLPDDIWDKYFRLDELGLGYEAHIAGIDGEMFIYKAELDRDINDDTYRTFSEQIEKKCGRLSEDNFYGEIMTSAKSKRELQIVLDLGSAYDDKAITGILRALNEVEGVVKVTVNGSAE